MGVLDSAVKLVEGLAADGAAPSGNPVLTAGVDDTTHVQTLRTATDGTVRIDPTGTTAQPVTDNGGSLTVDGTLTISNFPASVEVSNDAGNPLPVSGTVTANLGTLNGAATAAKQDTGNTSLASLDSKAPVLVGGRVPVDPSGVTSPISAASLPLPTGAATESTLGTLLAEGAPITGQSLETGGTHALGWLASLRKALTDRLPAALVGGRLDVNIGAGSVSVSGTVDTELPAAVALNSTILKSVSTPVVGAALLVSDATNYVQPLGDAANGLDVDVTRLPALPAGTNVIGHVIGDSGSTTAVTGNVATTNAAASQADGHSASIGATTDAAATTDTGTFSLIALVKRLLQRFVVDSTDRIRVSNYGRGSAAGDTAVLLTTAGRTTIATGSATFNADGQVVGSTGIPDSTDTQRPLAVHPFVFNGTNYDRFRGDTTNGLWVNIKNAVALAVSQSGTWTVQPGNTANTTAWKVDGSAVTQPVSGTVSNQAATAIFDLSATSPSSAITTAGTPITGLGIYRSLMIASTLQGATGGLLDIYVQVSPDSGTTWYDYWHANQQAIGTGATNQLLTVAKAGQSTAFTAVGTGTSPSLAAKTCIGGDWGDRMRVVFVAGSGTTLGAAQTIKIFAST